MSRAPLRLNDYLGHILEAVSRIHEYLDMRNILAHGYYKVDLGVVWKTIERDLPYLKEQVSLAVKAL